MNQKVSIVSTSVESRFKKGLIVSQTESNYGSNRIESGFEQRQIIRHTEPNHASSRDESSQSSSKKQCSVETNKIESIK